MLKCLSLLLFLSFLFAKFNKKHLSPHSSPTQPTLGDLMPWKGVYQSPCDLVPYWPPSRSNFSSRGTSTGMPYYKKQQ
ncbi:hypothetical protein NC651_037145 [Populus alba x Populus x berolinensis]|nr:hypothetical protein NC651_037145 [Populus alba x Populus x berolinensis]